jgi:NADPH-dependent 2,4-dienoyl-CoA reductase/sulfur reductase-like enzyme
MKIIVIGINHAGTSAVRTLLAQNKNNEITAYDRNDNISFLGCGIALAVGGEVNNVDNLFYCSPLKLADKGAKINMNHDVLEVNYKDQYIIVKNLKTKEIIKDTYDKLIYAAGSWPIELNNIPKENRNLENVEICKLFQHAKELIHKADSKSIESVAVIGSGYIGIELAEAYCRKGKKVTLIDCEKRVLPRYFDAEFTTKLEGDITDSGITLALNEKVINFESKNSKVQKVITDKNSYDADLVIKCVGFRPNTELLPDANKISNGAIIVDEHMKTNLPNVYAVGDAVAIYHASLNKHEQVALATNAVKSGIAAASNINGVDIVKIKSIVGTNAICVFGNNLASTGISEEAALRLNINAASSYVEDNDRPEFMKSYNLTKFKLVYDKETLRKCLKIS